MVTTSKQPLPAHRGRGRTCRTVTTQVLSVVNMSNQLQPALSIQQQPNLNSAAFPQCFVKAFNNPLQIKRNVITDDYSVTSQVLGMGINGRVLEIFHRESGEKYALKVNTPLS